MKCKKIIETLQERYAEDDDLLVFATDTGFVHTVNEQNTPTEKYDRLDNFIVIVEEQIKFKKQWIREENTTHQQKLDGDIGVKHG
jgi:hypothetical protein